MPQAESPTNCSLVLFTKAPIAGFVKTRLTPPLSPATCAELQGAFIEDALQELRGVGAVLKIYLAPDDGSRYLDGLDIETLPQGGGDLGLRMVRSLNHERSLGFRKVLLVGADIPELEAEDLREGYGLLNRVDVVFGPARDGGFYCMGSCRALPEDLLEGIPWSGPDTLAMSEARVRAAGLKAGRMKTHSDVDDAEDLRRLNLARVGPATRSMLKRIGHLLTL